MRKFIIEIEKNFSSIDFDIQKCPLTYNFNIHSHFFTEIVVILNGSAIHIIDGIEYPVSKGHIYVINKGTQNEYKDDNNLQRELYIYYNKSSCYFHENNTNSYTDQTVEDYKDSSYHEYIKPHVGQLNNVFFSLQIINPHPLETLNQNLTLFVVKLIFGGI